MSRDQELILLISEARSRNNLLWMRLLEVAIEHAPAEAKTLLRAINANDQNISDLLAELAK